MRKCILSLVVTLAFAANAQATTFTYQAYLTGPAESPPVASPGTGYALIVLDDVAHTLTVQATFADLVGPTTVSHIHCCTTVPFAGTVGVATFPGTFPGFPAGVTSGTYTSPTPINLALTTSFTGTFLAANGGTAAGAEAGLIAGLDSGRAYFNIHTTFAPGGEIRGFLTPVPEPATLGLLAIGLGAAAVRRRLRKNR